jgi:hypothetical protein
MMGALDYRFGPFELLVRPRLWPNLISRLSGPTSNDVGSNSASDTGTAGKNVRFALIAASNIETAPQQKRRRPLPQFFFEMTPEAKAVHRTDHTAAIWTRP